MAFKLLAQDLLPGPGSILANISNDKNDSIVSTETWLVKLLDAIQQRGFTDDDLHEASSFVTGVKILALNAATNSKPTTKESQDALHETSTINVKCPPGTYKITKIGDESSVDKDLGMLMAEIANNDWNQRSMTSGNSKETARIVYAIHDDQWHLKWSIEDSQRYDLVFFVEPVVEGQDLRVTFKGTLTRTRVDDTTGTHIQETVEMAGVVEDCGTMLSSIIGFIVFGVFVFLILLGLVCACCAVEREAGLVRREIRQLVTNLMRRLGIRRGIVVQEPPITTIVIRDSEPPSANSGENSVHDLVQQEAEKKKKKRQSTDDVKVMQINRDPEEDDKDDSGPPGNNGNQATGSPGNAGTSNDDGGNTNHQQGGHTNTNIVVQCLTASTYLGLVDGAASVVVGIRSTVWDFVSMKLAKDAEQLLQKSFPTSEPLTGKLLFPPSVVQWEPILKPVLDATILKRTTMEDIEDLQQKFLSRIQPYLISRLQGTLGPSYHKSFGVGKAAEIIDFMQLGNATTTSAVIAAAIKVAVRSPTIVDGIAIEARRISYAMYLLKITAVGSRPETSLSGFELQQKVEKDVADLRGQWEGELENFSRLLEASGQTDRQSVETIARASGLRSLGQDMFAPLAQPKKYPGVPVELLFLSGKLGGNVQQNTPKNIASGTGQVIGGLKPAPKYNVGKNLGESGGLSGGDSFRRLSIMSDGDSICLGSTRANSISGGPSSI
ncbi:MAG: hypothetical protein ASARMPRED_004551 [Alectoria sarmentosa]|nr:MAG: hypothetical protein ASARMPRED_004551 [Alectoria sarmentosa]